MFKHRWFLAVGGGDGKSLGLWPSVVEEDKEGGEGARLVPAKHVYTISPSQVTQSVAKAVASSP